MKSKKDPRHKRRRQAVKELFATLYTPQKASAFTVEILSKREELDKIIGASAPQWPVEKLNRIDLAVLRLATYEFLYTNTPIKVIIDEAVELAKEFGGESSPPFVNGVLGDVLKKRENERFKKR